MKRQAAKRPTGSYGIVVTVPISTLNFSSVATNREVWQKVLVPHDKSTDLPTAMPYRLYSTTYRYNVSTAIKQQSPSINFIEAPLQLLLARSVWGYEIIPEFYNLYKTTAMCSNA